MVTWPCVIRLTLGGGGSYHGRQEVETGVRGRGQVDGGTWPISWLISPPNSVII